MGRRIGLKGAIVALMFGFLSACGGDNGESPSARRTAANGDVVTLADLTFAASVVQHHAQSLALVDLLMAREVDPGLARVAEVILARQGPDIEVAVDWLQDWGEDVPDTMRDHANAHGAAAPDVDLGQSLPGALSTDALHDLEALPRDEFQQEWLELMIAHHEGALSIAAAELESGAFDSTVALASAMATSTQQELDELRALR